jgi:hypothetical protein
MNCMISSHLVEEGAPRAMFGWFRSSGTLPEARGKGDAKEDARLAVSG